MKWVFSRKDLYRVHCFLRQCKHVKHPFQETLPLLRHSDVLVYGTPIRAVFIGYREDHKGTITFEIVKHKDISLPPKAFVEFMRHISQYPIIKSTASDSNVASCLRKMGFEEKEGVWVATNKTVRIP